MCNDAKIIMKNNKFKKLLLLLNVALCFMGVGQVCMVQMSSYPLWAYVGAKEIHDYHIAWWHSIWIPLFIPAGLSMICTVCLFWFRAAAVPRSLIWTAIAILIITYGLTCIWWGPLMALIGATPQEFNAVFTWASWLDAFRLRNKTQPQLFNLLITTHWLRLALLTAYGFVIFWMSIIAFDLKKTN